jgi:hypothetical protein
VSRLVGWWGEVVIYLALPSLAVVDLGNEVIVTIAARLLPNLEGQHSAEHCRKIR